MSSTRDQFRAAALIVFVVLTAATFAGFALGATSPHSGRQPAATPLLLQSTSASVRPAHDCAADAAARQAAAPRAPRAPRSGV
jgi:hypothetical protein